MKTLNIDVTYNMPLGDIASLLISAFEGGSNYWYKIISQQEPPTFEYRESPDIVFPHVDYPLNPGGSLTIQTNCRSAIEGRSAWNLSLPVIRKGLQTMAAKYPHHFQNVVRDNADAETGDVFLQCCLFGELIFG